MYGFELSYVNVETQEVKRKLIEVDAHFFDTEHEVYCYSFQLAHDFLKELGDKYIFDKFEFIYC